MGHVFINDISETANEYERHNVELNNLKDIEIFQHDASMFLRMHRGEFDVIDIDPFGTPSPFLDSAGYCSHRNSLLCVTATDTSALCGTYKEPCIANTMQNLTKVNTVMKQVFVYWQDL